MIKAESEEIFFPAFHSVSGIIQTDWHSYTLQKYTEHRILLIPTQDN